MTKIHKQQLFQKMLLLEKMLLLVHIQLLKDNVKIDDDNIIYPSVYIGGNTDIGKNNKFFPYCSIGSIPQDLKYKGEKSKLIIGKNNTFREHCTAILEQKEIMLTTIIGDNSLFMVGVHIAHDCIIKNNVIFANQVTLRWTCSCRI